MGDIFLAHSRYDIDLRMWFDQVFAGASVRAVRLEFELEAQTGYPVESLQQMLQKSSALFVLLGRNLISGRLHTSNWVAAETGLARGMGKAVWVFEDWMEPIEYPVPFVDHYSQISLTDPTHHDWVRQIVEVHGKHPHTNRRDPIEFGDVLECGNPSCKSVFRVHMPVADAHKCPVCVTSQRWGDGPYEAPV